MGPHFTVLRVPAAQLSAGEGTTLNTPSVSIPSRVPERYWRPEVPGTPKQDRARREGPDLRIGRRAFGGPTEHRRKLIADAVSELFAEAIVRPHLD